MRDLCWADKLTLTAFCLLAILGWVVEGGWALDYHYFEAWLKLDFTVCLILWCVLRMLDFLADGPRRRAARRLSGHNR